jgi:hypothetical protein
MSRPGPSPPARPWNRVRWGRSTSSRAKSMNETEPTAERAAAPESHRKDGTDGASLAALDEQARAWGESQNSLDRLRADEYQAKLAAYERWMQTTIERERRVNAVVVDALVDKVKVTQAATGTEAPTPTEPPPAGKAPAASGTRKRGPRDKGFDDKCRGVYLGYLERNETPPTATAIAKKVGCSASTACRAIKPYEDKRKEHAKEDYQSRHKGR